ncbi:hypothetical protein HanIR_Chr16g0833121 [Helianthus annuus]|nr:hypothetical protein HanIR_Chr16g0833121 [Helianthus annuus]
MIPCIVKRFLDAFSKSTPHHATTSAPMGVFRPKIAQSILNTTPERKLFDQLAVSMLHLSNYIFMFFFI